MALESSPKDHMEDVEAILHFLLRMIIHLRERRSNKNLKDLPAETRNRPGCSFLSFKTCSEEPSSLSTIVVVGILNEPFWLESFPLLLLAAWSVAVSLLYWSSWRTLVLRDLVDLNENPLLDPVAPAKPFRDSLFLKFETRFLNGIEKRNQVGKRNILINQIWTIFSRVLQNFDIHMEYTITNVCRDRYIAQHSEHWTM